MLNTMVSPIDHVVMNHQNQTRTNGIWGHVRYMVPPTMAHDGNVLCDAMAGIRCWSWGASRQGSLRMRRPLAGGARPGVQGDRSRAAPWRCGLGRRGPRGRGQPLNGARPHPVRDTAGAGFAVPAPLDLLVCRSCPWESEVVRLISAWLISAYLLSHNTIHSTSRALFLESAEQALPPSHRLPPHHATLGSRAPFVVMVTGSEAINNCSTSSGKFVSSSCQLEA
jgi:hypothetical protein